MPETTRIDEALSTEPPACCSKNPPTEPERSRCHVLDPDHWTTWPVVPLKRSTGGTGFPDCGLVTALDVAKCKAGKGPIQVFDMLLMLIPSSGSVGDLQKWLEKQKKFATYPDVEGLVADGWRVD